MQRNLNLRLELAACCSLTSSLLHLLDILETFKHFCSAGSLFSSCRLPRTGHGYRTVSKKVEHCRWSET